MKRLVWTAAMLAAMSVPAVSAGYSLLNVGIDYLNQERYADAITWLDKAIAAGDLTPDQMHVAYVDRGAAYALQEQPDKAASDFSAALAISPDDLQTMARRSSSFIASGQSEKAMNDLQELRRRRPHDVGISFQRGLLNWEMGHYPDAADAFGTAVADGSFTYAWLWLQISLLKQGQSMTTFRGPDVDIAGYHIRAIQRFGWPDTLISFYRGEKDETAVFDAIKKDGENESNLCEANFYIAEWRILHGNTPSAKPLMEKAASDCPKAYIERHMAKFELGKLP
jgi:tetratricopeptide (TPR) repeat protein